MLETARLFRLTCLWLTWCIVRYTLHAYSTVATAPTEGKRNSSGTHIWGRCVCLPHSSTPIRFDRWLWRAKTNTQWEQLLSLLREMLHEQLLDRQTKDSGERNIYELQLIGCHSYLDMWIYLEKNRASGIDVPIWTCKTKKTRQWIKSEISLHTRMRFGAQCDIRPDSVCMKWKNKQGSSVGVCASLYVTVVPVCVCVLI